MVQMLIQWNALQHTVDLFSQYTSYHHELQISHKLICLHLHIHHYLNSLLTYGQMSILILSL